MQREAEQQCPIPVTHFPPTAARLAGKIDIHVRTHATTPTHLLAFPLVLGHNQIIVELLESDALEDASRVVGNPATRPAFINYSVRKYARISQVKIALGNYAPTRMRRVCE